MSKEARLGRRVSEWIVAGRVWGLGGGCSIFALFRRVSLCFVVRGPGTASKEARLGLASRSGSLLLGFGVWVVGV